MKLNKYTLKKIPLKTFGLLGLGGLLFTLGSVDTVPEKDTSSVSKDTKVATASKLLNNQACNLPYEKGYHEALYEPDKDEVFSVTCGGIF